MKQKFALFIYILLISNYSFNAQFTQKDDFELFSSSTAYELNSPLPKRVYKEDEFPDHISSSSISKRKKAKSESYVPMTSPESTSSNLNSDRATFSSLSSLTHAYHNWLDHEHKRLCLEFCKDIKINPEQFKRQVDHEIYVHSNIENTHNHSQVSNQFQNCGVFNAFISSNKQTSDTLCSIYPNMIELHPKFYQSEIRMRNAATASAIHYFKNHSGEYINTMQRLFKNFASNDQSSRTNTIVNAYEKFCTTRAQILALLAIANNNHNSVQTDWNTAFNLYKENNDSDELDALKKVISEIPHQIEPIHICPINEQTINNCKAWVSSLRVEQAKLSGFKRNRIETN